MKLIFASNNRYKLKEILAVLDKGIELLTLREAGIKTDIPEPYDTLEENASGKARYIYDRTKQPCFSEDTGLEVEALDGEPGVKSARYAGDDRSFDKNIEKLLTKLERESNRRARFRSVIALILDGKETLFEGICNGQINREKRGNEGFGYDPVFIPEGASKTFAEMDMEEKTHYSHRTKAIAKLVTFLNNL